MEPPRTVLALLLLTSVVKVKGLMLMDEPSCHEVEEAECGLCHTVYMEECDMQMVPHMMPKKVSMCKNVTRYEENCQTLMSHKMVEEKRPICKLETMKSQKVMRCKLGMKKMKKVFPKLECRKVAVGKEEKCVEMVKLHEEKQEVKKCSFHPKTICRPVEGLGCRRVRRTMCNYIDTNQV